MKVLHFADAHIDAVQTGKWDPETGLPVRVMDFLNALDRIITAAIYEEKVDLVLFAGDAYKDRNPAPAYQAEFAKRILELEAAEIPTHLLVGNHDMGPRGRAHALTDFITFQTEYVQVEDEIMHLREEDYDLITLPWIHKSNLDIMEVIETLEKAVGGAKRNGKPLIFLGHCSVTGVEYSTGQMATLGDDLMLPKSFLEENGFDYVALGHIHKPQNLNKSDNPPIIYPGSIERVDWGEAGEEKYFVIADFKNGDFDGHSWHPLPIRPFFDGHIELTNKEDIYGEIQSKISGFALNVKDDYSKDPMIRVKLSYPAHWAGLINNQRIEEMLPYALSVQDALSVQVVHEPVRENKARFVLDKGIEEYSNDQLLKMHFEEKGMAEEEVNELVEMGRSLMHLTEVQNEA